VNHRISLAEIETRTKIIAKNIHPIMDTLEEREECTSYMIGRKRWYDFSAITTNEDAPVEPETPQQQENE
jgi:ABC-type sulfate transport system permease subunit